MSSTSDANSSGFLEVWSKLARNCILVGQVDAFCLACEQHLPSEQRAAAHMCEPQHAARLRALPYCPAHEADCIKKVKGGYFCGMCNVVVSTAARVGVHVGSAAHGSRRGALLLRRAASGGVLAQGTVLLRAAAWHGLVGDACLLCDEEIHAPEAHINEHAHLLKLVQSRALFGPGKSVYRKIDEDSYQCLTCNNVFDDSSFNEHFDSIVHKTILKQSEITDENQVSDSETNGTDINDRSIDHKRNGDVKTSIDVEQNAVAEESLKTSEVTNVDVDDVASEPMVQHLDSNNDSKIVKEPVVKDHEMNNKNEIKNNLKTKEDTEEAAEAKIFEHVKENAPEIGSIDVEQNFVTEKSPKISEVTTVDLDDVCCVPTAQHLDSKHDEKLTLQTENGKEPAEKDNEIRNENEIQNNLEIRKDTEEAADTKTFKHVKENAPEIGSNNTDNRSQILESVSTFQKNEVNINLINDNAFCKKCKMNIDFDFSAINKHIDDHKKPTNKNEHKKVPFEHGVEANGGNKNLFTAPVPMTQKREPTTSLEDIRALAKKHGMMYNGRELHCTMCDSVLPVSIRNIEEHISGNRHKAKMPQLDVKQEPKKNISKQLIELFVKDTKIFNDDNCLEQVINEKYCISLLSLMFVDKTGNKLNCLACDMKISSMLMYDEHVNSPRHVKILERSCVITSLESEFVREMLPGVYHCGFCNAVTGDWKGLEKHLNTSSHKKCKGRAERRLKKHMSDVRANKTKPGVYNCSFCNYVANDWDTLNRHFSTSEHMRTKAREEQRLRKLMDGIPDPNFREQMDFQTFETFKTKFSPNFSSSDSDSD